MSDKNVSQSRDSATHASDESIMRRHGYMLGATLGKGSFAKVKSGTRIADRLPVAIKVMNRARAPAEFRDRFMPREMIIAPQLKHSNIIYTYEIIDYQEKVYMIMEMAPNGDMLRFIRQQKRISEDSARRYLVQITSALDYMHRQNIAHRDMKCENLLLDRDQQVKITDFGFSRMIRAGDRSETYCGSAAYASPEVLMAQPYDASKYDIWSTGVILFIMVCGCMPFDDSSIRELIRQQKERLRYPRSVQLSSEVKDCIRCILNVDPRARYAISQIRAHPWVRAGEGAALNSELADTRSSMSGGQQQMVGGENGNSERKRDSVSQK